MKAPAPQVPWTTRLGTIGEKAIQSRLAYFSNPTKYEKDTGLDFYCELLENDSPSLSFYVQAKGTEHFDDKWGSGIPKSTITYWLTRQHPVFLIVYDEKMARCYWMSVEDHRYDLIHKIFTTNSETIYVKVDRSNELMLGREKNDAFVSRVKADLNSVQLFRGNPQFIGEQYAKRIPLPPRSDVELSQIKESVRGGLYSLFQHYDATGDVEAAQACCEYLVVFDRSHYNHFVWLGRIYRRLGRVREARGMFDNALRICKADTIWPRDSIKDIMESIEAEIRSLGGPGSADKGS